MRVLTVAAHPDDETLGAGGTMARLAAQGHEVWICILTDGVTARHAHTEQQKECAIGAADVLGAANVVFCELPDQRLDSLPLLDVITPIEKCHRRAAARDRLHALQGGREPGPPDRLRRHDGGRAAGRGDERAPAALLRDRLVHRVGAAVPGQRLQPQRVRRHQQHAAGPGRPPRPLRPAGGVRASRPRGGGRRRSALRRRLPFRGGPGHRSRLDGGGAGRWRAAAALAAVAAGGHGARPGPALLVRAVTGKHWATDILGSYLLAAGAFLLAAASRARPRA